MRTVVVGVRLSVFGEIAEHREPKTDNNCSQPNRALGSMTSSRGAARFLGCRVAPRRVRAWALVVCLTAAGVAVMAQVPSQRSPEPYRRGIQGPLTFAGPGREEPEPDVAEVVIGWFGPGDPDHAEFGSMWRGALVALDEENVAGGYCPARPPGETAAACKAFRLVPAWSESPWQAGIADLLRVVYDQRAWAVVGGVDGATTHLALQVALKSRFLLLSPGSTDVSTDRANVPWLFSLPPSDDALATRLVGALAGEPSNGGFAIVAATEHSAHASLVAVKREMSRRQVSPLALVEFEPTSADLRAVATHVLDGRPRAVLVLASAGLSAGATVALRQAGFSGTILGGAAVARAAFQAAAGDSAEGVLAPVSIEPGPAWDAFAAAYERRWGAAADEAAGHANEAVKIVTAAIRRAGLNRARIRDVVGSGLDPALISRPDPTSMGSGRAKSARARSDPTIRLARWTGGRLVRLNVVEPVEVDRRQPVPPGRH
jgi:ABC-type branched-subunit amino acid transport system substrate-binding protein